MVGTAAIAAVGAFVVALRSGADSKAGVRGQVATAVEPKPERTTTPPVLLTREPVEPAVAIARSARAATAQRERKDRVAPRAAPAPVPLPASVPEASAPTPPPADDVSAALR